MPHLYGISYAILVPVTVGDPMVSPISENTKVVRREE